MHANGRFRLKSISKIFGSECAVESETDSIHLVEFECARACNHSKDLLTDVESRSVHLKRLSLGDLPQHPIVLQLFDGGNVGDRQREIKKKLAQPGNDAWAETSKRERVIQVNGATQQIKKAPGRAACKHRFEGLVHPEVIFPLIVEHTGCSSLASEVKRSDYFWPNRDI